MRRMKTSAYEIAERYVGMKELPGPASNPFVLAWLRLDTSWPEADEVPWCSAMVNAIAWQLRLPRSKSLRARSWLTIGTIIDIGIAEPGFDVVILKRGKNAPRAEVIEAPGHVGFYAGHLGSNIQVLGGNQGNAVSVASFPLADVLGVRRLA